MPLETLETLRLLTNLETEKRKLLQVVLFGQPELDRKLATESVRQLRQRITFQYRLGSLTAGEIGDYVAHRLAVAGSAMAALFSPSGGARAPPASRGVPRLVNILAHKALLLAFGEGVARCAAPRARGHKRHARGIRAHASVGLGGPGLRGGIRNRLDVAAMSVINKMLQDLDKRHAAPDSAAPDSGRLAQQVRPVKPPVIGSNLFWRVMGGVMAVVVTWVIWVMWQIMPHPVVTDLAYQGSGKARPSPQAVASPFPRPRPQPGRCRPPHRRRPFPLHLGRLSWSRPRPRSRRPRRRNR